MKILRIMISLVLLVPSAYAKEIADINFDEAIVVPGVSQNLQLNGLGIRYKFFFKIYIGALYVEKKTTNADELITHPGAKRVVMHFLYDEVSKEKLTSAWIDGFEDNLSDDAFGALKPRIDKFNSMFETVKEGDVVLLDYIPGKGTRVTIKGQQKGFIEGEDFNQALLKIWLGEEPVTDDLKEALLGL